MEFAESYYATIVRRVGTPLVSAEVLISLTTKHQVLEQVDLASIVEKMGTS